MNQNIGKIRIGTISHTGEKKHYEDYKQIEIMTYSSPYFSLSPYSLKDEKGRIHENIWQFSKVYPKVPKSKQFYSRFNNRIIWNHPEEQHIDEKNEPNEAFYQWQNKGFSCLDAIRYPVTNSKKIRASCLYSLYENPETNKIEKLNYIEARKKIYLAQYLKLVKNQPQFEQLLKMVKSGKNILITEVDGPKQESLPYYMEKYKVSDNFIKQGTMEATRENLILMLNDGKHPFGHGYACVWAILDELNL